ncbi:capsular polysaccharide synthesis protein [Streptococcus pneumoniae]|uniref:Putative glycosyl transferase n=1 Tax=Streptococcus pneumoniae TaxID=1313 RepID=Q4K038_STREE|nr:capsular polysaccharide synthesis protein [Streptococcus pneumoniae]MDS5041883.1 capsular polysaccharide synthesis protein [Streptococcus pneumoniae]MDS5077641.1 capsular polysaccharide synthesis protein [Streptococcus pneumoniae]MDS8525342.1 capsular polysaccharide synthesis protein [Streptococcus pneumoniae]MDS8567669.1 capsular polysaccharide synthesis protein [Streptococcus pneumoniae]CAI34011.1 putative glycosyl transferase [Streptococcus pneumoniae]
MSIFATLIKKKGAEIFKNLIQSRVLFRTIAILPLVGFSKKSLEIVRLNNSNIVLSRLRRNYRSAIQKFREENQYSLVYDQQDSSTSSKIWICWFQGLDVAPHVVRECIASVRKQLADREVVVLTDDNYHHYVTFPDHIKAKIDQGIISKTHLSDLLRLELLTKYGGTWIDGTVFCSSSDIPVYMLDSDLFLFQNLKPGLDGQALAISTWFMTAAKLHHPLLELTKDLLYLYWKKNNTMVDYFLIHHFFQLSIEEFPEYWSRVVPFNNSTPHILQLRLFEEFDETMYRHILEQTPFHKLTYKFEGEKSSIPNTYYKHLF